MSLIARCLLTTAAALLVATGCKPRTYVFTANNSVTASADLTGIRHTEHGDMVTARLGISGNGGELESADLQCLPLYVGSRKSRSVWVDSHVDYARGAWPATNGKIEVDVYWAMPDDVKIAEPELRDAKLAIEEPTRSAPCFVFRRGT